jgi:D-alanine-D-alanine ligase-like ATP-grasp enzyme
MNRKIALPRNIDDGWKYVESLGFPVIIKPNNLSQWVWVQKIENKWEYYDAATRILEQSSVMIIEKFYTWRDYRVVVFNDEIISAYTRIPLCVVWDGISTISELLDIKQTLFIKTGRDTVIEKDDPRISIKLSKQWLTYESIPNEWEEIFLLDNANLSTWWESIDVTSTIHPDFQKLAIQVTRDMWLKLCGVDFMTQNIELPLSENKDYIILELNGAPGLDNYLSAWETQRNYVKNLYRKILISLSENE